MQNGTTDQLRHNLKQISWISFKNLETYFCHPDVDIKNISAITAEKFADDLETIIQYSKITLHEPIGNTTILMDEINPEHNENNKPLQSIQPVNGKHRFHRAIFKRFKASMRFSPPESHPVETDKKMVITSWHYDDFKNEDFFRVGSVYSMKPESLTCNFAGQNYKYDRQIISRFKIEQANRDSKEMIITDTIKNGRIKREKRIDDEIADGQNYDFEIRNHRLNRGLMKAFLFRQIKNLKKGSCCQSKSGFEMDSPMFPLPVRVSKPVVNNIYPLLYNRSVDLHSTADDYGANSTPDKRVVII